MDVSSLGLTQKFNIGKMMGPRPLGIGAPEESTQYTPDGVEFLLGI